MPYARIELIRLLKIHQEIARGGYPSVRALAELCEVNDRTIKRDIRVLREELDAPLKTSRHHGGYYYTRPFSLAPEPFTQQELLALSLSIQIADTFKNTPFVPAMRGALQKLRQMQGPAEELGASERISLLAEPAPPESVESIIHFNELFRAIEGCRRVRMTYYTMARDEETEREMDPYHLYYHNGMWYVFGHCRLRDEDRDFAVPRIRALTVLNQTFPAPDAEAIRRTLQARFENLSGDMARVRIRFDEESARRIRERVWHPSQQLDALPDGACILTMTVSGLTSVMRWLLSFGRHAQALEPPALVQMMHEEVQAMGKVAGKRG